MKKKERRAPPVETAHDRRSRKRAKGEAEEPFPHPPKAPDGISGSWE